MIDPSKYGKNVKHVLNSRLLNLNTTLLPEMWLLTYLSSSRESVMVFRPENTNFSCQSCFFDAITLRLCGIIKIQNCDKDVGCHEVHQLSSHQSTLLYIYLNYTLLLMSQQNTRRRWMLIRLHSMLWYLYMHKNSRTIIDYMWMRLWHNV